MVIHRNIYIKFFKLVMKCYGIYPYQSKFWKRIMMLIFHVWGLSVIIALTVRLGEDHKTTRNVININIAAAIFSGTALIENWILYINETKVKDLFDKFMKDWEQLTDKEEEKVLSACYQKGRNNVILFLVYCALAYTIFGSLILSTKSDLNVVQNFPYYFDSMIIYDGLRREQILVHCFFGIFFMGMSHFAVLTSFVISCSHTCGIFQIMRYRFRKSNETRIENLECQEFSRGLKHDEKFYSNLIDIVKKHNEAIHTIHLIEQICSRMFLFVQVYNFTSIGILIYDIIGTTAGSSYVVQPFLLISIYIIHLYWLNSYGQDILQTSDDLYCDVSSSEWYTASVKTQKLLCFIMLRTQKPEKLTACSVWTLTMENFTTILKGAWSVATVLRST